MVASALAALESWISCECFPVMGGGIPTCNFAPELGLFRVLSLKGKSFATYGIILHCETTNATDIDNDTNECKKAKKSSNDSASSTKLSRKANPDDQSLANVYLFIEETLFLHERGLLEVNSENGTSVLNSQDLYEMLSKLGVEFSIYLTYAHLRSQTYIVMRHTPHRLDIVDALVGTEDGKAGQNQFMVEAEATCTSASSHTSTIGIANDKRKLKRNLRCAEAHAPAPHSLQSIDVFSKEKSQAKDFEQSQLSDASKHCSTPRTRIAFDVYNPNASFRRSNPGRPNFCVAVTSYAEASPMFSSLTSLVMEARGVPVRIATVADGGTVVLFSLTEYGVPPLDS